MECVDSRNGKLYKIFDVAYDSSGFPVFLIYKDGQWIRQSAKHFIPHYDVLDEHRYQ